MEQAPSGDDEEDLRRQSNVEHLVALLQPRWATVWPRARSSRAGPVPRRAVAVRGEAPFRELGARPRPQGVACQRRLRAGPGRRRRRAGVTAGYFSGRYRTMNPDLRSCWPRAPRGALRIGMRAEPRGPRE
jgi:hypothetical protein